MKGKTQLSWFKIPYFSSRIEWNGNQVKAFYQINQMDTLQTVGYGRSNWRSHSFDIHNFLGSKFHIFQAELNGMVTKFYQINHMDTLQTVGYGRSNWRSRSFDIISRMTSYFKHFILSYTCLVYNDTLQMKLLFISSGLCTYDLKKFMNFCLSDMKY